MQSLTIVVLLAAVAGCGGGKATPQRNIRQNATAAELPGQRTQSITIARSSDVTSLNPQELTIGEDYNTQEAIYAGLVRPTVDGKTVEGDLASSWSFDEPSLTYTFKLRPGLKFSDGKAITGADIIYSIGLAQKGPVYGPMFAAISSVTAPAADEVKVKLSKYSSLVLPALAFAFVVPNNLNGKKPAEFFKHPVSSGEYSLVSWEPSTRMTLKRNGDYWDAEHVLANNVVYQIISDENARLNALVAGNAQLDEYVPDEQMPALPASELVRNGPRSALVMLSTNNARPPFNDPAARQAVSLAIDRPLLLKTIWKGYGVLPPGLITPSLPESHTPPGGAEGWQYDPGKASSLLHGAHPTVTLLTSYERGIDSSLVDVVQRELTQVGFHVNTEVRDFATVATQFVGGKFSIVMLPGAAYLPTAGELMTIYATLFAQFAHWDTKTAQSLLAHFSEGKTLAQRKTVVLEFERWIHDNWLANPVGCPDVFFGVAQKLRGLNVSPFSTYRLGTLQLAG